MRLGLALLLVLFGAQAKGEGARADLMLCYHRFGVEKASDPYQISLERFGEQLAWLAGRQDVQISIDDGYASGWEAADVLEKYGKRAVYFVYPGSIGKKKWLSWGRLKELEKRGHTVASHTLTHPNLAKPLKGEPVADFHRRISKELLESKRLLEEGLGHQVRALAYPYGAYNPWVEAQVKAAGYVAAYTVSSGAIQSGDPPLRLRRFLLMGQPSLAVFQASVERQFQARPAEAAVEEGAAYLEGSLPGGLEEKAPGFHFLKVGAAQFLYHVVAREEAGYFGMEAH